MTASVWLLKVALSMLKKSHRVQVTVHSIAHSTLGFQDCVCGQVHRRDASQRFLRHVTAFSKGCSILHSDEP